MSRASLRRPPALAALAAGALLAAPSGAAAGTPSTVLSARLGLRIDGRLWRQHAGEFVARAGDVNGDGLADVLVGTHETHRERPGRPEPVWDAYVVFGRRDARGAVVRLDRLGSGGLRIVGRSAFASAAGVGDVNGDGLDDIALGTGETDRPAGGAAYVVFGRRRAGTVDVGRLGRGGFAVTGAGPESRGEAVAGGGDVDRDGYADLLVAEPEYVPPGGQFGTGRVVVVYGGRSTAAVDTRHLGRRGSQIIGPGPFLAPSGPGGQVLHGVGFGSALAGVGDISGDRRPDVVIGAPGLGGRAGGAFVVLAAGRRGASIDLREPEQGWYRIDGEGGNAVGSAVASAGDQNGDGLRDVLIGERAGGQAAFASGGPSDAYVVFGRRDPGDVRLGDLGALGAVLHDAVSGDRAGQSIAGVGDVTGDGRPDLLVGAPLADPRAVSAAGSAFLVPGGRLHGTLDLRDLPGRGARRYDGTARYDTAGWAVAGLGDVNGGRRRDIAVAAPRTDALNQQSGSVLVVLG